MQTVAEHQLVSLGAKQLTSLSAAVGIDPPAGAVYAHIQAEGTDLRIREDGTAPTAAVGRIIHAGTIGYWCVSQLNKVKLIEVAASAKANIEFFQPRNALTL